MPLVIFRGLLTTRYGLPSRIVQPAISTSKGSVRGEAGGGFPDGDIPGISQRQFLTLGGRLEWPHREPPRSIFHEDNLAFYSFIIEKGIDIQDPETNRICGPTTAAPFL